MIHKLFTNKYREVLGSIIQLMIVVLILPLLLYIISELFLPKDAFNSFLGGIIELFDDVPLVSSMFNLVSSFHQMAQTTTGYIDFFNHFLKSIGPVVVEAMISGMCVLAMREISVMIGIPGVPAIGIMIGMIASVFFLKAISAVALPVKVGIFIILLVADILLVIFSEPLATPSNKLRKKINIIMIGFQAVIAGYSMFYAACVLQSVAEGLHSFKEFFIFLIFPSLVLIAMLVVDFWVATAKKDSFRII